MTKHDPVSDTFMVKSSSRGAHRSRTTTADSESSVSSEASIATESSVAKTTSASRGYRSATVALAAPQVVETSLSVATFGDFPTGELKRNISFGPMMDSIEPLEGIKSVMMKNSSGFLALKSFSTNSFGVMSDLFAPDSTGTLDFDDNDRDQSLLFPDCHADS